MEDKKNMIWNFNQFMEFYSWPMMAIFIALIIWSCIWKGVALWKAARGDDKWWFIVLLVVNTVGILEIIYIYVFSKKKK